MKILFWLIGILQTILFLPVYILGFIWRISCVEFRAGIYMGKRFEQWLNNVYKKIN